MVAVRRATPVRIPRRALAGRILHDPRALFWLQPTFKNGTAGALIVLALASLLCAVERESQNYVTWRLYTLYLFVLQDSFFPNLSEHLYPAWIRPENRLLLQGTPLAHGWLILSCVLVAALLAQRPRAWRAKSAVAARRVDEHRHCDGFFVIGPAGASNVSASSAASALPRRSFAMMRPSLSNRKLAGSEATL
jgi:hypothetical protein